MFGGRRSYREVKLDLEISGFGSRRLCGRRNEIV
jgi:hypothetical protein